jgi:LPS sulfotransferase NodH
LIKPVRSYLVCATQRSGSTLLCELLKDTAVAGRPDEYFEAVRDTGVPPHPRDYLGSVPGTAAIREDPAPVEAPAYSALAGLTSYREHLERTFRAGTTPNGVFGSKLMWNQLPELEALAGQLPEYAGLQGAELLATLFGDPLYVWVSRRDKVRQAVSMWRALQSRSWRADEDRRDAGGPELVYSYDAIAHLAARFAAEDRAWGEFIERHRLPALAVSYEDELEGDPEPTVSAVLERLGVVAAPGWRAAEPLARQADSLSEEWVAAYHRDRTRGGSAAAAVAAR